MPSKVILYSLLIILLFGITACNEEELQIESTSFQDPYFSQELSVYDASGQNYIKLLVVSDNQLTYDKWSSEASLSLLLNSSDFDDELNEARYPVEEELPVAPTLDELSGGPFLKVFVEEVNVDQEFNEYSLQVSYKNKERDEGVKDFNYAQEFNLRKRWHNGKICWTAATPTNDLSNTIHYTWYRKWRQLFRKFTYLTSGNLNAVGECSEIYYHGYRLRLIVLSNFRNFTISQRKYADDPWETIY